MKYLMIFIFLLFPYLTYAQDVVINEFLIDPQPQQVELFNKGTETIDISNWHIDDNGGSTYFTIPASTSLLPQSCIVFPADYNLNKSSSDTIRLFNSSGIPSSSESQLIDSFTYDKSQGSNISYFRTLDGQGIWTYGAQSISKSNVTNTSCIYLSPTPTPTLIPTNSLTPTIAAATNSPTPSIEISPTLPVSFTNVYINEVVPYPDTNQKEWVEIYNNNNFTVALTNWHLDDIDDGGSSPKVFSLTLDPYTYGIVEISSLFNNDEDDVRLLDDSKFERDRTNYSDPAKGDSWGRNTNAEFCYQLQSKNFKNNPCIMAATTVTPTKNPTPTKINIVTINANSESPHPLPTVVPSLSATYVLPTSSYVATTSDRRPTVPPKGEVQGVRTYGKPDTVRKAAVSSLSFASFSFSLLSIISLVLRIKTVA